MKNAFEDFKILEVGSGGGGMAIEIAQGTGCTVHGIDSSYFAVARARAHTRARGLSDKVVFETQRAESLSFPCEFFDLVYTVKTLHETRAVEALKEMHRVLKSCGKIIIIDWVKGAKTWVHERYFSPEELEVLIEVHALKLIFDFPERFCLCRKSCFDKFKRSIQLAPSKEPLKDIVHYEPF